MNTHDALIAALNKVASNQPKVQQAAHQTFRNEDLTPFEVMLVNTFKDKLKRSSIAESKVHKALAQRWAKASLEGKVKAKATKHPLVVELDMTLLVLDKPNLNRQGIKSSEVDNIVETALHMPIRADFREGKIHGHASAVEVGVITEVQRKDNVITAAALLWTEQNEALADYVLAQQEVETSFEVYYASSSREAGTEWLENVVFASQALVSQAAYGRDTLARVR